MPLVQRYFPPLSDLISFSFISNDSPLASIKAALLSVLSNLYYKDLQFHQSTRGNGGFYSLKIVTNANLELDLLNSGVSLVLNPDSLSGHSAFPVTFSYEWELLAILKLFDSNAFDIDSAVNILDLANDALGITDELFIANAINVYGDFESTTPTVEQFVTAINARYASSTPVAVNASLEGPAVLEDLSDQIYQNFQVSPRTAIYNTYLSTGNVGKNLSEFFKNFLSTDVKEYIRRIIVPRFKVTTTFIGGIKVPRKWLQPMQLVNNEWKVVPETQPGEPRAYFTFAESQFLYDSGTGFGATVDLDLSSATPVTIGNTGIVLSIEHMKLDLQDGRNLPEIDADGREPSFKGIYLKKASVSFPANWKKDQTVPNQINLVIENAIIGNSGGISGTIKAENKAKELYVPFTIASQQAITVDVGEGVITASGALPTEKQSFRFAGSDTFIRDGLNHLYKVDSLGLVSSLGAAQTNILAFEFLNGSKIAFDSFYLQLRQNNVVEGAVVGTLTSPLFDVPLTITLEFDEGFLVKAYAANGLTVYNRDTIEVKLNGLEFGKTAGEWQFGIAGRVTLKKTVPVLDKMLPQYFQLHYLRYRKSTGFSFNLEAGWKGGTIVRGDDKGGITGYIPINLSAENNGLLLKGINFKAKAKPHPEIEVLLVGAGFKIGPVGASVDDFGVKLAVSEEDEDQADFGGTKTDISLVGPKGILVDIKTKVIEGAGYLYISDDEYIGALSLTLNTKKLKIGITAVGIITTKMPDGGKGTAVLALLSVSFTPGIPLIWGFQLQGVGGLVGIHHTINTTALREGAKAGTLNSILFPVINIKDTAKIVDDLKTVFPIKRDQFLIGLMAKIVWPGAEPTLFIDFGLMVEFSSPVRFAIIGKLSVKKGGEGQNSSGDKKLVKINVAFVGIIDFDEKYMSFDASIFDSQIGSITLAGDMAMRLFWGDYREFLLSIGGFHPAYDVPAYLKLPAKMTRVTLCLINKKIDDVELRLILELYIAITTNTLQFGAKLDLHIKFWKLEIIGLFGFDVLFQFKPFRFIAKVYAMLAVLFKGSEILSISMDINLVGPGPWHADGKATFKVLGFEKTCEFERTWGDQPQIPAEPPMPIEPLIVQDLQKPGNWIAQLPDSSRSHVQLKDLGQGALVMDPLGELSITQRTAPLGVNLYKFGEKQLSDPGRYDIAEVVIQDGTPSAVTYSTSQNSALFGEIREDFAPTQFKDMNDAEKLKAKSFEYLRSGVKIGSGGLHTDGYVSYEAGYDIVIVDNEYVDRTNKNKKFPRLFVNSLVRGGALASNPVALAKNQYLTDPLVEVVQEKHVILAADTLDAVQVGTVPLSAPSLAEALDLQQNLGLTKITTLAHA